MLLPAIFAGYRINNTSTVTLKNPHNFLILLCSKAIKARTDYLEVLSDVTFFATFFYRTFALLGSPTKYDGDKMFLKFLFLLHVTLMVFFHRM